MQLGSVGSGIKAYTSSVRAGNVGFTGTTDPQTPAEKLQRILRGLYHAGNVEGRSKMSAGFASACRTKSEIVEMIKDQGDMTCKDFAKLLESPVGDDLSSDY